MSEWRMTGLDPAEIWEGELVGCQFDSLEVLLVNIAGDLHAFQNRCPHAGAALSHGSLEKGVLTCPAHLWQFDLVNDGAGINPRNCKLTSYPVRIDDGMVMIRVGST